jgi:dCTP deaminase
MSALSSEAILDRLRNGLATQRLVISPLLDEKNQIKAGQSSVDIRLGFDFCLVSPSSVGMVDEFAPEGVDKLRSLAELYRHEYVPLGCKIVIHPHQLMLAQTLEYLKFPPDLMGYVVGRSTWGRLGLIVATAVGIHPNFAGSLTLELRNLGETPLALYPGQSIAQLFVHDVRDKAGAPSAAFAPEAQYVGRVDMVPRQMSSESTHLVMQRLIQLYQEEQRIPQGGNSGAISNDKTVKSRRLSRSRPPSR